MSAAGDGHQHDEQRAPFDWFSALDILVWASIVLILVLAAEWAYGTFVREKIAREAQRHIAKARTATEAE